MTRITRKGGLVAGLLATTMLAAPMIVGPILHGAPAQAREFGQSYADLVKAVKPAVVTIVTTATLDRPEMAQDMPFDEGPFGDFFRKFFENRPGGAPFDHERRGQGPRERAPHGGQQAKALGSGFVIDADGVIVTNRHVVENATEVKVVLDDGAELPAEIVGADDKTDIAVLRVQADEPLPTVGWADSDSAQVGDGVIAIGNPFGLGGTVTSGIISARGRDIHAGPYDDFIQTDASINRGNSGGPLFNEQGGVIGVNTAIISPSGGNIGLGFSIPANQAKQVVAQILEHGHVERGMISVRIQAVTPEIAESLGLPEARGALVASVEEGGPADKAGVKPGDVILGFGDARVDELRDLTRAVAATAAGAEESLTVWRGGDEQTLPVTVGRMEPAKIAALAAQPDAPSADVALDGLGLSLTNAPEGGAVIADVDLSKPAGREGLRPGDRILAVNQEETVDAAAVEAAVSAAQSGGRSAVLLQVARGDTVIFVGVPFGDA